MTNGGNHGQFVFDYESAPGDRRALYAADPILRRRRIRQGAFLLIALAWIALTWGADPPGGKDDFFVLGLVSAVALAAIEYLVRSLPSVASWQAFRACRYLNGRYRALIGPDAFVLTRPDGQQVSFGWSWVGRAEVTGHAFVLFGHHGQALAALPRRVVPPEQADELASFLQAAVSVPGDRPTAEAETPA